MIFVCVCVCVRACQINISPEMEDQLKSITLEQVKEENKTKILVVDNLASGHFICSICNVPVNSIKASLDSR